MILHWIPRFAKVNVDKVDIFEAVTDTQSHKHTITYQQKQSRDLLQFIYIDVYIHVPVGPVPYLCDTLSLSKLFR